MSISRRSLVAGAGAASVALATTPATAAERTPSGRGFARATWLGVAGWRLRTPTTTLLVDPYLTRFDTGLAAQEFDATTALRTEPAAVDEALGADAVDRVLLTHTHWDHVADVPYVVASRGASVLTTLSGYHLLQAWGTPAERLAVVKGGEELVVGDVVVRVVRSLHSRTASGGLLFPGVRVAVPPRPATIADLPEGDTLAFQVRGPSGRSMLFLGASDLDEQALTGLAPDAVAVPVPTNDATADYVPRLMAALDRPRLVVPVHWDDFESPRTDPPSAPAEWVARRDALAAEVRRVSPRTRVVVPDYRTELRVL